MSRRIFLLLLLALFCTPLVTHIYLGTYSPLVADDFCSAAVARSEGVFGGAIHWYMNWTGRYAANFLDALFWRITPAALPYVTGLVITIWLITLAIAVYQILRSVNPLEVRALVSCVIAAMGLFTVFDSIPAIGQTLYWAGMRSVLPGLILGTAYVALIARRSAKPANNKLGGAWVLVAALLTFVAVGFAETLVAVQTTAIVFALAISLASNKYAPPNKRSYLLLLAGGLIGSLAGGLIVFVAPGNKFRQTPFPPPPAPPEMLGIAFRGLDEFFRLVVFSSERWPVWMGLILCAFVLGLGIFQGREESHRESRHLAWALVWLPVVTFVLLLACWVPMAWGTSLTISHRMFITPAYLLVCLVVCWAYLAGRLSQRAYNLFRHRLRGLAIVLPVLILLVFGFVAVIRSRQLWQLRPTLAAYARESASREQLIQNAKAQGLKYVVVPRLQHWDGLDEIELDPKITWLTKCFQDYYGIVVIPELGDLSGETDGEIKQVALEKQFDSIRILPGSSPTELSRIYKTRRGKAGFYKVDVPPDQIKLYYESELARLGWKYIGTKKVETFQRYYGGTQNLFCNGETAAILFITDQDGPRLGYSYSLALNWGMSSGYVWGVVDCPR